MKTCDNIVITGISGRFPECENVDQFKEALLNGIDLVTENDKRYPIGIYGVPTRSGVLPEIDKFDNAYFGVHAAQANFSDPRQRILLETVYECIVDAGYNPDELRGSKIGVYVGVMPTTSLHEVYKLENRGYANIGFSSAVFSNRVSYCFDFKGPTFSLDTACSSGLYAFVNALRDLRAGITNGAIVGVSQLILNPNETKGFNELNMLSPDGKCKTFGRERNGYVRSETIASLFLQRESHSRRIYATVLGAKANSDGYKEDGLTFPSSGEQMVLLKEIYEEANLDPTNLSYVEAHGTGTPAGDREECRALAKIFGEGRRTPLPIGSVKSNMGHSEASSALASIFKVIIAMESGFIPANLNACNLDTTLPGILEKKLKVLTENLLWKGGIVGVNSFGFGGANAHLVLKSHEKAKAKTITKPKNRLVVVSGRTEEAVSHFLEGVQNGHDDEEFLALVDEIHKNNIQGHPFRGFVVLGENPVRQVKRSTPQKRPVWFIYSGMGSQWVGMGRDFMSIKVFRETFLKCAEVLKPLDVDLVNVIMDSSSDQLKNMINTFVAITAVQVALTNLLFSLGIVPDGIAGHSLGEVACGYADGSLTAEEAVLLSYARGKASTSVPLPKGLMAAVGMTRQDAERLLPEDTFIACYNGKSSLTISGLETPIRSLVEKLKSQGIFAKIVDTGGIAFHTKYIADAGETLMELCKKAIKNPKPRSVRWISTSVPGDEMDEPLTKFNNPEYHYRNYISPVLFTRVYEHIPKDALVVEIAPQGLLQAILKRELDPEVVNVSLASRSVDDNEQFLLAAIGRMYLEGAQPNLRNFYSDVSFPVGRGTKMISPLVKWDHSVSWFTEIWKHKDYIGETVSINVSDEKYSYLRGHFIDGRVLMPATGYLELVWRVMARMFLKEIENLPVVMEEIKFKRATVLPDDQNVQFVVNIFKQSGRFEIFEGGSVVVSGKIKVPTDVSKEFAQMVIEAPSEYDRLCPRLSRADIYKELRLRRYMYKDSFQAITECNVEGLRAEIEWSGKFACFMDAMLHPSIILNNRRDLSLPTSIDRIVIDPATHLDILNVQKEIPLIQNRYCGVIKAGGIEIVGLHSSRAPRRQKIQPDPYLETCHFVHYDSTLNNQYDLDSSLSMALQIISENSFGLTKELKFCEIIGTCPDLELKIKIETVLEKQMLTIYEYVKKETWAVSDSVKYDVIILDEKVAREMKMESVSESLTTTGFILCVGNLPKMVDDLLRVVFQAGYSRESGISLLRSRKELSKLNEIVKISNNDFGWLDRVKKLNETAYTGTVYLVSQGESTSGVVGLTKCLLTETNVSFKCVFIDQESERFSIDNALFRNQLEKNLTINVLRDNDWGTFVYSPFQDNKMVEAMNASVTVETLGDLSTLKWIQRPIPPPLPKFPDQELVNVHYSALNFRDAMIATGSLHADLDTRATAAEVSIGIEYSGVTSSGRRVMGLAFESFALQLRALPKLTWEVPDTWSLQEAATVPVVYSTCYYAMMMRGQMKLGESILIQAGTGGVGLAAISIALSMNATIFTTVSSDEKKEFLKKMFPQLEDKYIGNSRNKTFQTLILNETKGRGVDLVLNSLASDLFQASLKCIAKGGRFLEIGKIDFTQGTPIDSSMFLKDCSFHGIFMDDHFGVVNAVNKKIHELVDEGIKSGVVKPLPTTVYNEDEVEDAFRFLSTGKHKGKVLIKIREENSKAPSLEKTISATPKIYFDPTKSYILIGGLGGFGLELADWMIKRGATKIVLNTRSKMLNGYQGLCLKKWLKFENVTVKISVDDTSTIDGAKQLVLEAQKLGPVAGVFNTALVLRDGILANQTTTSFEETFKCKIVSGRNMDEVTRSFCPDLEHFVMFSSVTARRGNGGQTNYAMANSALERLCEKRKRDKLPALAIEWGPIGDVGFLAGLEDKVVLGMQPQHINSCLKALENFMLDDVAIGCSIVLADDTGPSTSLAIRTPVEATAHILGIKDINSVDNNSTLSQLGMDSLMVAEIKQTLYRNFQLEFSVDEIRQLTFDSLASLGGEQISSVGAKPETKTPKAQSLLLSGEAAVTLNNRSTGDRIVFFVHPAEGQVDSLRELAKATKATVYGLQCTKDSHHDTISALARHFVEVLRAKQPKGPYRLCGYSYGALLAVEIALQLEERGEEVAVVALDGSPEYARNAAKIVIESEMDALKEICETFLDIPRNQFAHIVGGTWEDSLRDISTVVARKIGVDWDLINSSIVQYYKRGRAAYFYEPKGKIRGKVTLIRVDCGNQYTPAEDYGLQEMCQQKVNVVKVNGNHYTIVMKENLSAVSKIINESLI